MSEDILQLDLLKNWLSKQASLGKPPRPGLVPQSGDPRHPDRWIRPQKIDRFEDLTNEYKRLRQIEDELVNLSYTGKMNLPKITRDLKKVREEIDKVMQEQIEYARQEQKKSEATNKELEPIFATGKPIKIKLYRGEGKKQKERFVSDPGDFGAGKYYSTHKPTAKSYGPLTEEMREFKNPLVLSSKEAFEKFQGYRTIHGKGDTSEEKLRDRLNESKRLSNNLREQGYDALFVEGYDSPRGEYTVLDLHEEKLISKIPKKIVFSNTLYRDLHGVFDGLSNEKEIEDAWSSWVSQISGGELKRYAELALNSPELQKRTQNALWKVSGEHSIIFYRGGDEYGMNQKFVNVTSSLEIARRFARGERFEGKGKVFKLIVALSNVLAPGDEADQEFIILNPYGSKIIKEFISDSEIDTIIKQEAGGFAGIVFSSSDPGIFTPTFSGNSKGKKNKKSSIVDALTKSQITVGSKNFNVEMAVDRYRGLSGRDGLSEGHGMLFPSKDENSAQKFYMRDMKFSLDFIVIGRDSTVVHVERSVSPSNESIFSFPPGRATLEINGGEAREISIGDAVSGIDSVFEVFLQKQMSTHDLSGVANWGADSIAPIPKKTGYRADSDYVRELAELGVLNREIEDGAFLNSNKNFLKELENYDVHKQDDSLDSCCQLCDRECNCVFNFSCQCNHDCECSDLELAKECDDDGDIIFDVKKLL